MTIKRKVREDFNPGMEYSVDVLKSTIKEKMAVQQAFFDVGIEWQFGRAEYQHLHAVQYTNKYASGGVSAHLLRGSTTENCNMTAEEFLSLVYEPEQEGHVHAESMAQYAEDAKTQAEPWKLWQTRGDSLIWWDCRTHPSWANASEYRRKPMTHIVNGVEIPDYRFTPEINDMYCYPAPNHQALVFRTHYEQFNPTDEHRIKNGLCYKCSEEGRQAAILHAKAWLGE